MRLVPPAVCERWPEMGQRDGRWFSPDEAAELVEEEGLRLLLRGFNPSLRKRLKEKLLGSRSGDAAVQHRRLLGRVDGFKEVLTI